MSSLFENSQIPFPWWSSFSNSCVIFSILLVVISLISLLLGLFCVPSIEVCILTWWWCCWFYQSFVPSFSQMHEFEEGKIFHIQECGCFLLFIHRYECFSREAIAILHRLLCFVRSRRNFYLPEQLALRLCSSFSRYFWSLVFVVLNTTTPFLYISSWHI